MALFLIVAGLTGIVLAYEEEIEGLLIPEWLEVESKGEAWSPFALARLAESLEPRAEVNSVRLFRESRASARISLSPKRNPATGKSHELSFNQLFLDPYTGKVLGQRLWGELGFDAAHVVPMLYRLHYTLLLGDWGKWLFGAVALIWAINCFIGFYLSLPPQRRQFFKHWKRSWLVRAVKTIGRFSFDLHRAAGLWVWAMLLILALSALQFNLNAQIFRPVLTALLPFEDVAHRLPKPRSSNTSSLMDWETAHEKGRALMARQATSRGFAILGERFISVDRQRGVYIYSVKSTLDIREDGGQTRIYFSGVDGGELAFYYPTMASGNAVSNWLSALHMRSVWGAPYQAFVALIGLLVAILSITGVIVWWKRRRPSGGRHSAALDSPT